MTNTWMNFCRMLESTENLLPTIQIARISKELENFEPFIPDVLTLLSNSELESNGIGLAKAQKWLSEMLGVYEDEMKASYTAHNDLGSAVYHMDYSAETQEAIGIKSILNLLQMNCSKLNSGIDNSYSNEYNILNYAITNMSSLERKWFIRYWIRVPRNGIDKGTVTKILAKWSDKKIADVKNHLNLNSISDTTRYYLMGENPPMEVSHGNFVAPMLAKDVPMNKWPENKIVDYKYDGNRYQIHKEGDNVIIFNRKGSVVTQQFQDVVEKVRTYNIHTCILDGEIYPINEDGSPAEHKLMATRVHSKDHAEAREKVKVKWVIFDCLKFGKDTIMDLSYSDRVIAIKTLPDQAHRMPEDGNVLGFYNQAINDGFEGIIVKDATLPYEAGKRSKGWAKYKPPRIELDVAIVSAKYGEGAKSNVFATFGIAVKNEGEWISVGSVGTGFSDEDLLKLTRELRTIITGVDNGTYFFTPRTVLEVSADLITRDSSNNIGLRFPRCKRIREDKFVIDCNTLEDVENLI